MTAFLQGGWPHDTSDGLQWVLKGQEDTWCGTRVSGPDGVEVGFAARPIGGCTENKTAALWLLYCWCLLLCFAGATTFL